MNTELNYGKHSVKVSYEDKTSTQEIDFNNGDASEINVELYECYEKKLISSTPSYASILIDGENVGSTPLYYKLLNSEESVTIKKWL